MWLEIGRNRNRQPIFFFKQLLDCDIGWPCHRIKHHPTLKGDAVTTIPSGYTAQVLENTAITRKALFRLWFISHDSQIIHGRSRNYFLRFWFTWTSFDIDTEGRLFVIDVSFNWATNRNWQTKIVDTWKISQLNLPREERVNELFVLGWKEKKDFTSIWRHCLCRQRRHVTSNDMAPQIAAAYVFWRSRLRLCLSPCFIQRIFLTKVTRKVYSEKWYIVWYALSSCTVFVSTVSIVTQLTLTDSLMLPLFCCSFDLDLRDTQ